MKLWFYSILLIFSHSLYADESMQICVDYHCESRQLIYLQDQDIADLLGIFEDTAHSAPAEREKIQDAIALFESIAGKQSPTHKDLPENLGDDQVGQLDCISESMNTSSYLQWLDDKGLFKFHVVEKRVKRRPGLFAVHWGVQINEIHGNQSFVVDSWYGKHAQPPAIQPLDDWMRRVRP